LGQKRVSFLDLEMDGFNSELEGVEENSVSPDMDVRLAFAVQVVLWHPAITTFVNPFTSDVPSEALAFSLFITKWAEDGYKRS
jgi:hypothetical protein